MTKASEAWIRHASPLLILQDLAAFVSDSVALYPYCRCKPTIVVFNVCIPLFLIEYMSEHNAVQ